MQKDDLESRHSYSNIIMSQTPKLRSNPLFYAIQKLLENKFALLKKYSLNCVKSFNQAAFYIQLPGKPSFAIYHNDYTFTERHFTVHEHFKDNISGLSFAHYTERYENKEGNPIIIHVYFNKHGDYLETQIKKYLKRSDETTAIKLPVNLDIQQLIQENAEIGKKLLLELLEQTDELHTTALAKAKQLEEELALISKQLQHDSVATYIAKANEYIKVIEDVNRYSRTSHDKRGSLMAKQLNCLHLLNVDNETKTESKLRNSDHDIAPTPDVISKGSQQPEAKAYDLIISNSEKLKKARQKIATQPDDSAAIIACCKLIDDIQMQVLTLSPHFNLMTAKQKNKLNTLLMAEEMIKDFVPQFLSFFWNGDLEAVKVIYPYIEQQLNLEEIFLKLVECKPNKDDEPKLQAVFDFLHQQSAQYRLLLRSSLMFQCKGQKYSLLSWAAYFDNLFAFNLLLAQGIHPNGLGGVINGVEFPTIFMLETLASKTSNLTYLELLIKAGANYKCKTQLAKKSKKIKHLATTNPHKNALEKSFYSIPSKGGDIAAQGCDFFEWCLYYRNFGAMKLFAHQFHLIDNLSHLAYLSREVDMTHLCPAIEPGCRVIPNDEQSKKRHAKEAYSPSGGYYMILFKPDEENMRDLFDLLIKNIKTKVALLKTDNSDILIEIYAHFYSKATSKDYTSENLIALLICIYYLVLDPSPTQTTYQELMRLYCYKAKFDQLQYKHHNSYELAYIIADASRFSVQLKTTPIFKHTVTQLAATFKKEDHHADHNSLRRG